MYLNFSNGVLKGTYNTLAEAKAAMQILVAQKLPNLVLEVPS